MISVAGIKLQKQTLLNWLKLGMETCRNNTFKNLHTVPIQDAIKIIDSIWLNRNWSEFYTHYMNEKSNPFLKANPFNNSRSLASLLANSSLP